MGNNHSGVGRLRDGLQNLEEKKQYENVRYLRLTTRNKYLGLPRA